MALLFMDGFDASDVAFKWTAASGQSISATTRFGVGRSVTITTGGGALNKLFTPSAQITVGMAVFIQSNGFTLEMWGDTLSTYHITLQRNNTSKLLEVLRAGGALLATGTTQLLDSAWAYIEIQATVADAGGTVKVRINGSPSDEINFTGDTRNAGTSTNIDAIRLRGNTSGTPCYDDLYILNSTGATNNTFLGDVRIHSLLPNGNGTDSQLTGSDGNSVNNYLLTGTVPIQTATYAGSATVGQRDTYAMADVPANITSVFGVQNNIYAAKSDASFAQAKSVLRTGGSLYSGTTRNLATTYITYSDLYETNPNTTVAWTVSDVNAIESGMEVV